MKSKYMGLSILIDFPVCEYVRHCIERIVLQRKALVQNHRLLTSS